MGAGRGTLTLVNGDDDDDFQNPIQVSSLSQSRCLSTTRSSGSKPLKPSSNGGTRPRKKAKLLEPVGKENRLFCGTQEVHFGSRFSVEGKVREKVGEVERRQLFASDGSRSVDFPTSCPNNSGDSHGSSNRKEIGACDCLASKDSSVSYESNASERIEPEERNDSASVECSLLEKKDTCVAKSAALDGCMESKELKMGNCKAYAMSIEYRLLRSRAKGPSLDEDEIGDFEAGTQLNELMNLCSEMGDEGNLGDKAVLAGDLSDLELAQQGVVTVECPLCGTDITDFSEELRQAHTNDCLDRDNMPEANISSNQNNQLRSSAVVSPVLEFIRSLGLSRYEDVFIREEVDWDTLQWLTEEDLLSIGVSALGPRKKIVHALKNLRRGDAQAHDMNPSVPRITAEESTKLLPGNKLITEYFQGSSLNRSRVAATTLSAVVERSKTGSIRRKTTARNYATNGKLRDFPSWCCIPGTPFRVDAFRFLRGDCSHWFLTHFHIDHYQGLTRNFSHGKIYCSSITANLINAKIGVSWDRLHVLPLNQKISIAGVSVTCLDANHCPGSVIILFEPPNGKAVLHTGDFRFCEAMANCSILQSCRVHTLILDTTYCNPQYDFPKQEAVIQFVIEAIQAEAFNPKTLFLIGSYTVGKERLFLEVARFLRKKVYVGAAKLRLLQCLGLPEEDVQWFTLNEMESNIHIVPMWTIASFKRMKHISNQYSGRYNLIVAFSPTGWTFGKGKKKSPGRKWQQGTIIRYEVPYSEHCSFSELKEFVQFLSPEVVIPSVNNSGPESADAMVALLMSQSEQGGVS